jgi:WhiB family redox-sensing transcriptional regulator
MIWAACADMDTDLWFPDAGDTGATAKRICAGCPVRVLCLNYALDNGEQHGIWGGKSKQERRLLLRKRRAVAA